MVYARSASTNKYINEAEDDEMTLIPQAYWDDLLDRAFATLNAIPVDL
jgi:hypothetical protein